MRLSFFAFALLGASAAVWAQASGPALPSSAASLRDAASEARALAGVRALLAEESLRGLPSLADLVIGAPDERGARSFRARAGVAPGPMRPVFGRAEPLCDASPERPSCWRLSVFEIDGKPAGSHPERSR